MDIRFRGKVALVTGAGKGIGRDTAVLLSKCQAHVIALSRCEQDLRALQEEIACETICVDLEDSTATKAALAEIGRVDLLVNNAAIALNEPFFDVSVENFDKCFAVNVRSVMVVTQIIARGMATRGSGSIVNVSSQSSFRALQDHTVYCATKGALDQMTRVVRCSTVLFPYHIFTSISLPTLHFSMYIHTYMYVVCMLYACMYECML
jgi:L-xylulose reductase|eukprot:COSAG01_NODE_4399_length_5066_cov_18.954500_3_plen_207_part_00